MSSEPRQETQANTAWPSDTTRRWRWTPNVGVWALQTFAAVGKSAGGRERAIAAQDHHLKTLPHLAGQG